MFGWETDLLALLTVEWPFCTSLNLGMTYFNTKDVHGMQHANKPIAWSRWAYRKPAHLWAVDGASKRDYKNSPNPGRIWANPVSSSFSYLGSNSLEPSSMEREL